MPKIAKAVLSSLKLRREIKEQTTDTFTSFSKYFLDPLIGQKGRGLVMSLVATILGLGFGNGLQNTFGIDDTSIFVFIDMIASNFFGFALDILAGSRDGWCSNGLVKLTGLNKGCSPEHDFKQDTGVSGATGVLINQISSESFWAFWVSVIFDILVSVQLFDGMKEYILDNPEWNTGFLADPFWRRAFLKTFVSTITFFIYANLFRFNWAYESRSSPVRLADAFVLGLTLLAGMDYFFTIKTQREPPYTSDGVENQRYSLFKTETGKNWLVIAAIGGVLLYTTMVYGVLIPFGIPRMFTTPRWKTGWAIFLSILFLVGPVVAAIQFTKQAASIAESEIAKAREF